MVGKRSIVQSASLCVSQTLPCPHLSTSCEVRRRRQMYYRNRQIRDQFHDPIGILAGKSVEAAARQPESVGQIQKLMILAIAFIEALCLYALLIAFTLAGKGKTETVDAHLAQPEAPVAGAHQDQSVPESDHNH